jgi:mono/diheme cytochrome c family protein
MAQRSEGGRVRTDSGRPEGPGRRAASRPGAPAAAVAIALLALVAAGVAIAAEGGGGSTITAASGPSVLTRLKTGFQFSSMGRAGYTGVAAGPATEAATPIPKDWLVSGFEMTGEDVFRVNCRSCHGVGAQGLHPAIPNLLAKAREAAGKGGDAAQRNEAAATEMAIRHRLLKGGMVMPSFEHLDAAEVEVLLGYLESLPSAQTPAPARRIRVPAARVGENVVKAVCQICHDATPGEQRPAADQSLSTLSEFPVKYSVRDFVARVHATTTGGPGGHKPRLDYLRPEEIEAAYVYLIGYPPVAPAH